MQSQKKKRGLVTGRMAAMRTRLACGLVVARIMGGCGKVAVMVVGSEKDDRSPLCRKYADWQKRTQRLKCCGPV